MNKIKRTALAILAVVGTLAATTGTAAAAPPERVENFEETFQGEVPAGALCDFALSIDETYNVRITLFTDKDGNVTEQVKYNRVTKVTGPGGSLIDRGSTMETLYADGSVKVAGNRYSAHQPGGGILLNGSGLLLGEFAIVGDFDSFEIIETRGPSQDITDFPRVCEFLG